METVRFSEMLARTYQTLRCLCICNLLNDLVCTSDYRFYCVEFIITRQ